MTYDLVVIGSGPAGDADRPKDAIVMRIGLVGCGAIGVQVAQKVRAFGANVLYHDRIRRDAVEESALGLRHVELDALLGEADIVSLHLPLLDSTRGLIDERALGLMKRTAILINTARGEIVDTVALASALAREGRSKDIIALFDETIPGAAITEAPAQDMTSIV